MGDVSTGEFANTPAAHAMRWVLGQVDGDGPALREEEVRAVYHSEDALERLGWIASKVAGFQVVDERAAEPSGAVATITRNGRYWELACTIDPDQPTVIADVRLSPALPPGMEVRRAVDEDNEAILELCRRTPIVLGDASVVIEPLPDYFDYVRLMDRSLVMVLTDRGSVVGVHCGAIHSVLLDGQLQHMAQVQHSRILPQYEGLGLWGLLNRGLRELSIQIISGQGGSGLPLSTCAYFAVGNESARRLAGSREPWSCHPVRVTVPCQDAAERGRRELAPGSPDAAGRIVEIINACHDGEELFVPYTRDSLEQRLSRAPDLYSWGDVLCGEGSVVGLRHAGQRRTRTVGESATTSIRSLVLDYGFLPGHEDEFLATLAACAREGARQGMTHLSLFTSEASAGYDALLSVADGTEAYEFVTPYSAEPAGVADRGIYVDQIYF